MVAIRRRKKKKIKKARGLKYWLITVGGYDQFYSPPYTAQTLALMLPKKETPLDWFAHRPKAFCRFEFEVTILYNFWQITAEQYYAYYRSNEQEPPRDPVEARKAKGR